MIRIRSIAFIVVLLFSIIGCSPSKSKKPVLMILREQSDDMELMLTKEVGVMKSMLEKAGYKVVIASASGQPLVGSVTTITPDLKLTDVKIDDYSGVILPCMAAGSDAPIPPEAVEIVKKVVTQGKPIAAQATSLFIMSAAGALDGKQYAMYSEWANFNTSGIYKGEGVVQDGNMITSGICPFMARLTGETDGTTELTQKFIDTLASHR
jgi:putative intracellular protease/amidase